MNHEKSIQVDSVCANAAIKHNMLYISVYQLIKDHICKKTEWGQKLQASRKARDLIPEIACEGGDEAMYSAVHYD